MATIEELNAKIRELEEHFVTAFAANADKKVLQKLISQINGAYVELEFIELSEEKRGIVTN